MKPLRIYTPVFGAYHIGLLDRCLGQSLRWPKNAEAIKDARWTLLIHPSEFSQVMEVATKILPEKQIDTVESDQSLEITIKRRGVLMCRVMANTIQRCNNENSQMLISTPDFIWSDGTIANMRAMAEQKNVVVSVPHIRVMPGILTRLEHPLPSDKLVDLAMAYPHESWRSSEYGRHDGTFKGGILWRRVNGVIAMQHRMPSPFLMNFAPEDFNFFAGEEAAFGAIDHTWAEHLVRSQRWRYALSSDLGFMAEVTEPGNNVPPKHAPNIVEPDAFWTQERDYHLLHQETNRQFIACLRGEK